MPKLKQGDLGRIVILRGLGYSQAEIAEKLGVTGAAIQYRLKQINKRAREEGNNQTFTKLVFGEGSNLLKHMIEASQ